MASDVSDATPLRMAVIGCGPIGALHAAAIAGSRQATLVAVCDPDAERRKTLAARWQAAAHATFETLLDDTALDAVTIATPDHLHVAPTLAAIERGCHVFCEKPLAEHAGEARRLVAAAKARGVWLAVDYNRRFAFGYRTAKRLLDGGAIGKLEYAVLRVSDRVPPPRVARHPTVIFTTLLTHHLDLMRFYGGEARRIQAHADQPRERGLLTRVSITLEFAAGGLGTIVAGYRADQTRTAEWLELGGASGALTVEDLTRRVTLVGQDVDRVETFAPNHFRASDGFYDSLGEHVQDFIARVARGEAPAVDGADGAIGLELAELAIASLAGGQALEVKGT